MSPTIQDVPKDMNTKENLEFFFKDDYGENQEVLEEVIRWKNFIRNGHGNTTVQEYICVKSNQLFGDNDSYETLKYKFELVFYNVTLDTLANINRHG